MVDIERSNLAALIAIGLLIVVSALLIAGYGVPTGIGFAVGVVLGTAASMFTWLWIKGGPPGTRSVSFGSWEANDPPEPPVGMQRWAQTMSRLHGVGEGPLRKVIPIGQSATVETVRVELTAIELREDGGLIPVTIHTRPPTPAPGLVADVTVTDDVGTEYVAGSGNGGGSAGGWSRTELLFAPLPPEAATTLLIRIDAFADPFGACTGRDERLAGPWEFRVTLS